jgi:hypothetical protein
MKFKIHFTVREYEYYFIVSGNTLKDAQDEAHKQTTLRGLTEAKNGLWSEEIKY